MVTTLGQQAIGSTVKITINGTAWDFIVVHKGKPSSIYDDSFNDGVILLMKDIYEKRQWHSSDTNDYANSTIRSYLNSTFLNLIDANIRSHIVQVKIPYRPGSGTSQTINSGANGLSCKIFLPAQIEVSSNKHESYGVYDGATWSCFAGMTYDSNQTLRIGRLSGIPTDWWLRSPNTYNAAVAWVVTANGSATSNDGCAISHGIRPALVLPSSLLVADDGTMFSNMSPTISGDDGDLGIKTDGFTQDYTITDADEDTITVTEKVNDTVFNTFTTVPCGVNVNTLHIPEDVFRALSNDRHTITVTVTDGIYTVTRTWTFTKEVTTGSFTLSPPLEADAMPTKGIVSIFGEFPPGCELKIEVCNNGNDVTPTWEDITDQVLQNRKFFFENKSKTANNWGVNWRVAFARGTAEGRCHITGIGGNFE